MSKKEAGKARKQLRKHLHKQQRTILVVGEGYAECALLDYIKRCHHVRGSGFTIKIGNARGKGAARIIEYALRQWQQIDYDLVAVLFDTDTDWNDEVRRDAVEKGLCLFPSEPCLEAELLRLHGVKVQGNNTMQIKKQFSKHYGNDAASIDYAKHFSAHEFEKSTSTCLLSGDLVRLIKTGRIRDMH